MPIGRESAYGTLAHVKTDEGRHTLIELVWQANRKRTAFLGREEEWHHDARQVVAEELTKAGHIVEHVRSDGSSERHDVGVEYPDWLIREEDKLKLLEKKRQAGELEKVERSKDRSSEAIAMKLTRPADEVDAMKELSSAANQKELVVAQRKLARYQRIADEKGALATKVVKNVPQRIRDDAHKQAEWVATKKKEKAEAAKPEQTLVKKDKVENASHEQPAMCGSIEVPCEASAEEQDNEEYESMLRRALAESLLSSTTHPMESALASATTPTEDRQDDTSLEPPRSAWRSRRKNAALPQVEEQSQK
jgi:hypothetical protein